MFLSKILILSSMIILYIVEENIFVAKEILKCHIKDCFKINGKQRILMPKNVNLLNSKILNKVTVYNLCRFWEHFSSARK